jgi:hypothetical protein
MIDVSDADGMDSLEDEDFEEKGINETVEATDLIYQRMREMAILTIIWIKQMRTV